MTSELTADDHALVAHAMEARAFAHAPISGYRVGAALRLRDGGVVTGCNVEDILLGLTCCAERVALFKAISEGHREFTTVAVVTQGNPAAAPCGSCRQMLHSWSVERVIIADSEGEAELVTLEQLLPRSFHLSEPVRDGDA